MKVFAKAGADIGQAAQPFNFLRPKLAFAVNDTYIDFQTILSTSNSFILSLSLRKGLIRINRSDAP